MLPNIMTLKLLSTSLDVMIWRQASKNALVKIICKELRMTVLLMWRRGQVNCLLRLIISQAQSLSIMNYLVQCLQNYLSLEHIHIALLCFLLNDHLRTSTVVGNLDYCVTKESLMDRIGTNMHEACQQIDKECRLGENLFDLFSIYFWLHFFVD